MAVDPVDWILTNGSGPLLNRSTVSCGQIVLLLDGAGGIYWRGRLVETDKDLVAALRDVDIQARLERIEKAMAGNELRFL